MTLKRYVLLPYGEVIDTQGKEIEHGEWTFELSESKQEIKIVGFSVNYTRLIPYASISATADDIFDLVQTGWLAEFNDEQVPHLLLRIDFDDGRYTLTLCLGDGLFIQDEVSALFAPIFENGEIVRYERVWKR